MDQSAWITTVVIMEKLKLSPAMVRSICTAAVAKAAARAMPM